MIAVILKFVVVPIGQMREWSYLYFHEESSIRNMQPTDPLETDPRIWACARNCVLTAYGNICFDPEHTTIIEMYRLRDDLKVELQGRINLETLKRLWKRLGETGAVGKSYILKLDDSMQDCMNEALF
jgi:hypothetical protein